MGRMSDLMIEMENETADEWIRGRLEDKGADEGSEEYRQLADQYFSLQEHLREQAEFESELKWLKENGSSVIHKSFVEELHELKRIISAKEAISKPYLVLRMAYAYAVTLLEAFLADSVKSLVSTNAQYFENSLRVEELRKARYSLEDLTENGVNAKGLAVKQLSGILYHNIPKVIRIFETVLDRRVGIDMAEVDAISRIRHDIVHRNGKTKDGEPIIIDEKHLLEAIATIEKFAADLQLVINKNA
tara:strand:+ start:596 stop:1333 length:738 start_codon:yes stop_codon:yes gene_type:complete